MTRAFLTAEMTSELICGALTVLINSMTLILMTLAGLGLMCFCIFVTQVIERQVSIPNRKFRVFT
jgi:hypothetical protein